MIRITMVVRVKLVGQALPRAWAVSTARKMATRAVGVLLGGGGGGGTPTFYRPCPLQGVEEDDVVTQPGAQVAGMVDVGSTVLHHHAVGSHVTGMPPPPQRKKGSSTRLKSASTSPSPFA